MENQPLFMEELNRYYLNSRFYIKNLNRYALFATLKYALKPFSTLLVLLYEIHIDNLKYMMLVVINPCEALNTRHQNKHHVLKLTA